jgi:hypothetical protein
MKTLRMTAQVLAVTALLATSVSAQVPQRPLLHPVVAAVGVTAGGSIGFNSFYGGLSPYGHWVNRPQAGWGWVPSRVNSAWRPYSVGHWAYSDYGWTWVSGEPWGWATYHYGRWSQDPQYGWTWQPGYDWAPAWVSWQQGGDYIGWAALPPTVGFSAGVGLELGGINLGVAIAPSSYCFVGSRNFLAANVGLVAFPIGRNADIFRRTSNITRYDFVGGRFVNAGLPVERVQQFTGRPVPRFTVANAGRPTGGTLRGNELAMYRPAVARDRVEPSAAIQRDSSRFVAAHEHSAVAHNVGASRPIAQRGGVAHDRPIATNRTVHSNSAVHTRANEHNAVHNNVAVHHPPAHSTARTTVTNHNTTQHTASRVNHPTGAATHPQPQVHHAATPRSQPKGTPEHHNPPPAEHIASRTVDHHNAPASHVQHSATGTQHAVASRPQHVAPQQHAQVHEGSPKTAPAGRPAQAEGEKRPPAN